VGVASRLSGRLVARATTDPAERQLLNVVDEIAIAAGTPVPPVYVLDGEAAINAFAVGFSSSEAVVAVTAGALKKLTRAELQRVIGHEFSHILNGDMRRNIQAMGLLNGILVLYLIGRVILQVAGKGCGGGKNDARGTILAIGLSLLSPASSVRFLPTS
jgi:Zn-dependent protease with chaperone function